MSTKQEATMLINSLPDDTVGVIIELLKKMLPQEQDNTQTITESPAPKVRLGLADGKYNIPESIDACNGEIAEMFGVAE